MTTQPPLTHPATNPDGTCDDLSCPCQQWSKQENTAADTVSDYGSETPCACGSLLCDLETRKYHSVGSARPGSSANRFPDSPALRRTRSIVHHAKMVEEQVKANRCVRCGHDRDVDDNGLCIAAVPNTGECRDTVKRRACHCKCIFPDTAQGDQITGQIAPSSFDHVWDAAPESMRRVTEIEAAELFYYAGRRDRETELLAEMNETLRGVVERIGAEGKK